MGFSLAWNKFRIAFSSDLLKAGQKVTQEAEKELLDASQKWLDKTDNEWPSFNPRAPRGARQSICNLLSGN